MKLLFNMLKVILFFLHNGVSGVEVNEVSVKEGDSVTLHTDVTITQHEEITWYFNKTQIANIAGDQSKICTDDQCEERFRNRLKLDHQTGSLTITNTTNTDSGEYELQIRSSDNEKIFNVIVNGVSAEQDKRNKKSMKEGESVTLDPAVPDSCLSKVDVYISAGVGAGVGFLLGVTVVVVIYYCKKNRAPVQQNIPLAEQNRNEAGEDGEAHEADVDGEAHETGVDGEADEAHEAGEDDEADEDARLMIHEEQKAGSRNPGQRMQTGRGDSPNQPPDTPQDREEEAQTEQRTESQRQSNLRGEYSPLTTPRGPGAVKP